MARIQVISFIIISSSVLLHTHSADDTYSVVLPHTVTALTGSCVQIPCKFNISNLNITLKNKQIYGVWLKKTLFDRSNSLVVFNSSRNITKGFSRIEMIGNLIRNNCTTVFYDIMKNHTDTYYFRLHIDSDVFKTTFNTHPDDSSDSSRMVRVNVIDSPQPPNPKISKIKYVMEGTAVNLTRSAEVFCPKHPPTISWSNISSSTSITTRIEKKPNKTQSVVSKMSFIASYINHRQNISCTVTYPRSFSNATTVKSSIMIQVLFPPKETHIFTEPSTSVSVGTNVTLTCKSKASPSDGMNFTWYKRGQKTPVAWTKNMTFTVTQNKTGWYFCIAQNKYGNQSSKETNLTVTVSISEQNGSSEFVIYGCTGGLLAFLVLSAVILYCMRTRAVPQASIRGRDQTDSTEMADVYCNDAIVIKKSEISEQEAEEIHYGEIDFSTHSTNHMTRKDPVEAEYAEIQKPKRKTKAQQQGELYVQVMNK